MLFSVYHNLSLGLLGLAGSIWSHLAWDTYSTWPHVVEMMATSELMCFSLAHSVKGQTAAVISEIK